MENNKVKEFLNDMFGEVRTINKDGELWFVAKDICDILGTKTKDLRKLLKDKGIATIDILTNGGVQQLLCVDEKSLYRMIFKSRKPFAEEFQDWIFEEVIPAIRQDGMYVNREEEMESVNEQQRKELMDKVDVLDKVGNLLLLGNSGFATTQQVADYYEVDVDAIRSIIRRHKEELESNGYRLFTGKEIKDIFIKVNQTIISYHGGFEVSGQKFANRSNGLFTKRAILNVGMLLTQSEIARELRSRLLDIVHDAEEVITDNGNTIVENMVEEILDEKA